MCGFFFLPPSFSVQTVRAEGLSGVIVFHTNTFYQCHEAIFQLCQLRKVKKTNINIVVKKFKRTVFISGSEILQPVREYVT